MDERLNADILAVCNTLGYSDGGQYFPDPQCMDSAKSLVLYLRKDTIHHDVRRLLGATQVLQKDLIPIFKMDDCKEDLREVLLRLMVNLTHPPLLLYEHGLPKNKKYRNHFDTITHHLQTYKIAFADGGFWTVVFTQLKKLIGDIDLLLESQKLTVERMMILIRNVLQVPADPKEELGNEEDASVHDQLIWALQSSGVMDLLLYISSSNSTREFCMHALEIITLLFREHTGEDLAKTSSQRNIFEKEKDEIDLKRAINTERLVKNHKAVLGRSFGGTFVVKGLNAPSGREQICHKPIQSVADLSMDRFKKTRKMPVNRRQVVEPKNTRRSTLAMRIYLKEFCCEFLDRAYNNLMSVVKDNLNRSRGQENDETYYLLAMRFFMEFNRSYNFNASFVSSTLDKACFHYVHGLVEQYHEMMVTDKENVKLWSKRAHTALRTYQELLSTLCEMEKYSSTIASSRSLQANIVYLAEYRELCGNLLNSYDSGKLSRNYLCDLVDTNHLFLAMLENFTRERTVLVAPKIKRRRSTIRNKKNNSRKKSKRMRKNSEGSWMMLEEKLTEFLENTFELEPVIPFDAALDTPIDEQKELALNRIATLMSLEKFNIAVSLHRAAKEAWPVDNQLSMESEISSLKSIFLGAKLLPEEEIKNMHGIPQEDENDDDEEEQNDREDNEEDELDEEDEEEERQDAMEEAYINEREFDFRDFLEKYMTVKVISNLANLFKHFETIPELTLHAILKMFHRFAFEKGFPALLCQASIFQTFQKILIMVKVRDDLKEAAGFIHHFWPKFAALAESNPKIFLELLFWKGRGEALEIQEGYSNHDSSKAIPLGRKKKNPRKTKRGKKTFTTEDENGEEQNLGQAENEDTERNGGRQSSDDDESWLNPNPNNEHSKSATDSPQREEVSTHKSRLRSASSDDSDSELLAGLALILPEEDTRVNGTNVISKSQSRILSDSDSEMDDNPGAGEVLVLNDVVSSAKESTDLDEKENPNSKTGKGKAARIIYSESDSE